MTIDRRNVWVHCYRGNELIASYHLYVPMPMDPSSVKLPSNESFIADAKMNLTTQGLARPPYDGIRFEVRWDHPGPTGPLRK
jgi:hypothetical protein